MQSRHLALAAAASAALMLLPACATTSSQTERDLAMSLERQAYLETRLALLEQTVAAQQALADSERLARIEEQLASIQRTVGALHEEAPTDPATVAAMGSAVASGEMMDKPPMDKPAMDKPAMDKPAMEKPAMEKPAMHKPAMEKPAMEKPAMEKPPMDKPAMEKPPMDKPAMEKPPMAESFVFDGWQDWEQAWAPILAAKFSGADGAPPSPSNRQDLLGVPLPQQRFLGPTGEVVDLEDLRGARNVVLVLHRGFSGNVCITCSTYTRALAAGVGEFAARDAQVFLVYPGPAGAVPAFLEAVKNLGTEGPPPFPVLLDIDLRTVRALRAEGDLAMPTAIIVDKQGLVRFAYTGADKDDRPSVPALLAQLDALAG